MHAHEHAWRREGSQALAVYIPTSDERDTEEILSLLGSRSRGELNG
jgi:hypothetical protein